MFEARDRVEAYLELTFKKPSEAGQALLWELVAEIERLQKLAKRGHGNEFVEGSGRFEE